MAVGPGGGTVTGPGGVELRIPEGAMNKGATFKIASFGPDLFPERPDLAIAVALSVADSMVEGLGRSIPTVLPSRPLVAGRFRLTLNTRAPSSTGST